MGLPGIPPFTILSPISSDEEIMLSRSKSFPVLGGDQLVGMITCEDTSRTLTGTAGEPAATRCSTLPVHRVPLSRGLRNCSAWCFAPRGPPRGHDETPRRTGKVLKVLAAENPSLLPVFRYSRVTQNLSSVFSTHVILRGPEEGHCRWTAHTHRSTGRSPR